MDPRVNLLLNGHATKLPSKFVFVLTNYHSSQSTAENHVCTLNLVKVQECQQCVQSSIGHLYLTPSPKGSENTWKKEHEDGSRQKLGTWLSSALRTAVLMNSQQLRWPAHDLHKTDPVNIAAWVEEGACRALDSS